MRTLYNNGRQGEFSIKLTKLPEALKQKATSQHEKENKEALRKSSSNRPGSQSFRIEEGHSEGDIAGLQSRHPSHVGVRAAPEDNFFNALEALTVDNNSKFPT